MDQNRHLRHTAYYDYGAMVRIACFSERGLTNGRLEELGIGPILFREEAIFRREIRFEDAISVDVQVTKATHDFARWSLCHRFYKADESPCAVINLDGAWIDLRIRKLTIPNKDVQSIFAGFPRDDSFRWEESRSPITPA